MDFTHLAAAAGLFAGICLQQHCSFLTTKFSVSKPLKSQLSLFKSLGLILELTSLAAIPMSTYILLSSLHILVFKHLLIRDEKRKLLQGEFFGSMAILSGCVIALLFGGIQSEITKNSYKQVFDLLYYGYTTLSLMLTLVMRRLGYFSGRVIVETGIPAQISSFGVAGLKILWLSVVVFDCIEEIGHILMCLAVILAVFYTASGFIRQLSKEHDSVIVMGGYYLWSLFYCLPISLFVSSGVGHSLVNKSAIGIGCALIVPGIYLHSFIKVEYLKAYKENKHRKYAEFVV